MLVAPVFKELSRRTVAQRGVAAPPVVEDSDVLEQDCLGVGRLSYRVPCTLSVFRLLKTLSVGELSQQLPLRLPTPCIWANSEFLEVPIKRLQGLRMPFFESRCI